MSKSQEFMKERHSAKDGASVEREGRLVFLLFLKPIVNGKGFLWKEPVVGFDRRMDVVVTYCSAQKQVMELKVWRGGEYHRRGLAQLADYFGVQGLAPGFLLVFAFGKRKEYMPASLDFQVKRLLAIWGWRDTGAGAQR